MPDEETDETPNAPSKRKKAGKGGIIVVTEEDSPVGLGVFDLAGYGPGPLPGKMSRVIDGKVYITNDFPRHVAEDWLRRAGVIFK